MLPPAPDTNTTQALSEATKRAAWGATGSRASRSSISSSLKSCTVIRPLAKSVMLGRVRTCTGRPCNDSIMALRRSRVAPGIASKISVIEVSCTNLGILCEANTGTLLILRPTLAASSSTKPTNKYCLVSASANAVCTPSVPAPNISNLPRFFCVGAYKPSNQIRATALLATTISKKIRGCNSPKLRGTIGHCNHNNKVLNRAL